MLISKTVSTLVRVLALGVGIAAPFAVHADAATKDYVDGFAHMMDLPEMLVAADFKDVEMPMTTSLYFTGDRLNRKIPKGVTEMIDARITRKLLDNKIVSVVDCPDCRRTTVIVLKDAIRVETPVATKEQFTALGTTIGTESFLMWDATEKDDIYSISMKLISASTGAIIWSKEYEKKITQDYIERNFSDIEWQFGAGTWGIAAVRKATAGGKDAMLSGVTTVTAMKKIMPWKNNSVGYGFGAVYFTNTSYTEYFDVSGGGIFGNVYVNFGKLFGAIPYSGYVGAGSLYFNDSRGFLLNTGFEFPFSENGYMRAGIVTVSGDQVVLDPIPGFETTAEFGGTAYDFNVGFKF